MTQTSRDCAALHPRLLARVMKHLILIGYRGTGKTTVARLLAERLGVTAVDGDPEIQHRTGKTIAEIFARDGETVFRDIEETVVAELLRSEEPIVLSTGGGAVLRPETRSRLRESGHVVWLTAEPETILARMQGDESTKTMRPSLTELPPMEEITALLEKRHTLYAETAHAVVVTDRRSVEEIVEEILRRRRVEKF